MRKILLISAALLFVCGAAKADDDWKGVVKIQASYDYTPDTSAPEINLDIDVVYDKAGRAGKAYGTVSYQRRSQGIYVQESIYADAICVGRFNGGNNYSVAARVVKVVGNPVQQYITYEFDIANKLDNSVITNTEADARATCAQQSGTFVGAFNHGYVIAK